MHICTYCTYKNCVLDDSNVELHSEKNMQIHTAPEWSTSMLRPWTTRCVVRNSSVESTKIREKKDPQEEIGTTYKRKLSTPATYQKISLNTVVMLQRAASAQRTKIMNDRTVEQSRTVEKRTRTDDHGLQNLRINIHGVQTDAESSQAWNIREQASETALV